MITTLAARYTTWVSEAAPNAVNFGKTGYVAASNASGARAESILWFASPFTDQGGNVAGATLRLVTRALPAGTHTLSVRLLDKWSTRFGSTHWANRPFALANSVAVTITRTGAQAAGTAWEFPVPAAMQLVASGQGFYGFVVSSSTTTPILIDNYGAATPTLTTNWSLAPFAPSSLSPSAGRSVAVAKPVLRFDFRDGAGETNMGGVQVQTASSSSGFGLPTYDSGQVSWSWASFDLNNPPTPAPAFTAPAVGAVTWWRVRVQDSAGLWSGWSQPTSWAYHVQPTLTMVTPMAGDVADPTPPVTVTFTSSGSALSKWRASLSKQNGSRWDVVESSGWRFDPLISWTPARGMTMSGQHRVTVDAWDSRNREAVPGANDYATVARDIRFMPSASVAGVFALEATSKRFAPEVTLTWSRTQVPDEWYIVRDDRFVQRVPGPALLVGGGRFRFVDTLAPSGKHTWKVWAIVNNVSSPSGAVTIKNQLAGTWLVDAASGGRVCIVGDSDHQTVLAETSAEHVPLGSRSSVVITSGQQGESGRVEGMIGPVDPTNPQLARVWYDQLMAWRPQSGIMLRLLHEGRDVAVNISEVTRSSVPGYAGEMWRVGFRFREVADFETSAP